MKRLVFVLVLAACGKNEKAPTCAEVTDHVLEITRIAYPGHGDMGASGNREAQVQQCEARKLPAAERRCMMSAKSMEDLGQCRRGSMKTEGSGSAPK
jgi:hypothetical protein